MVCDFRHTLARAWCSGSVIADLVSKHRSTPAAVPRGSYQGFASPPLGVAHLNLQQFAKALVSCI